MKASFIGVVASTMTLAAMGGLAAIPTAASAAPATTAGPQVTEHYKGHVFTLRPGDWHGAKDCAIVTPTEAYCFDTADEMNTFTATSTIAKQPAQLTAGVSPDVSCSGYTKIWNGVDWTNTGLAFHDWGYAQNLNSYVQTPFQVISWFSDGQRGYNSNNCGANIFTGFNGAGNPLYLPPNAEAKNLGNPWPSDSIELYAP